MKNFKSYLIIIAVVLVIVFMGIFLLKEKGTIIKQDTIKEIYAPTEAKEKSVEQSLQKIDYQSVFKGSLNPCEIFPKERIEDISGKKFIKAEFKRVPASTFTQYICYYYQEPTKYDKYGVNITKNVSISLFKGDFRRFKNYDLINFKVKQDKEIPFNHKLVYDQNGKFHHLDIDLENDFQLCVDTWWSILTEEEALKFVKDFVSYFKTLVST